jgi:hypothetical protein
MALTEEWERERAPKVKGPVAEYVMRPDRDSDEVILVVVFEDEKSYRANAEDPEQDKWYRRLREHLEADPAWEDGQYIYSHVFTRK